jgi:dsDNA-specific endonuclease/ATPase MutS2
MTYRKRTLRRMPEHTRKLAKLIGELESVARRLKNELEHVERLERWYRADLKRQAYYKEKTKPQLGEPGQSNTGGHQC